VLHGLTPGAQYGWRNLDTDEVVHISGQELLDAGVSLEINEKPGSALFTYKKLS
jgi:hypothetical protein